MMNEPTPDSASKEPVTKEISDEQLVKLYLDQDDRRALETLIERYQDLAFRVAWSAGCDRQLAEEAAQESFALLIEKKLSFADRGQNSFRGWFCSVAINAVRHYRRGEQRLKNRERKQKRPSEFESEREAPGVVGMRLEEDETRRAMRQALEALQPELRLPITLHYYEGVSVNDIGRALDLDAKTVRNRMTSGLDKIRRQLARRGITAVPAAIPALLADTPLPSAPPTLGAALRNLAVAPGRATTLPAASANSTRTVGLSGWSWAAAGLLSCAVIVGGTTYWQANRTPKNNADNTSVPVSTEMQTEKLHRVWNFNENSTADLPAAMGAWRWERGPDGIGRLVVDKQNTPMHDRMMPKQDGKMVKVQYQLAAFVFPLKVPDRPFCLIVKGAELRPTDIPKQKDFDWTSGFAVSWADERNVPLPNQATSDPVLLYRENSIIDEPPIRPMNRKFIFIGKWLLSSPDGDNYKAALRYDKEYPSDKLSCWLWNYGVETMELREATPEEVRIALKHIERLERQESATEKN